MAAGSDAGSFFSGFCLKLIDDMIDAKDQKDHKSSQNRLLHFHRSVS